jgi:hypothetical protein
MTQPPTGQNAKSHLSGFSFALIWVVVGILAVFILMLFMLQGMTGAFTPRTTNGGNISQWCKAGISKRIEGPVFSSDGTKFVLTMHGACKIGVYDMGRESMVYLVPPKGMAVYGATFHPQSDTVAFILARQVESGVIDYQLAISRIDGTGLKVLTSSDTRKRFPSYSFDGAKIVFEGSERCNAGSAKHCWSDIYEFDLESNKEARVSTWNALQVGPAHFLSGNKKIVTPIIGDLHPKGSDAIPVEMKLGSDHQVFIVEVGDSARYQQLALDTRTASSPKPLPSGEIAFISKVNEDEKIQDSYIYDVFLWSRAGIRRLTQSNRYIQDYAITNSAKSVLIVTEADTFSPQCGLLLWDVARGTGRKLKCDVNANELPLTP